MWLNQVLAANTQSLEEWEAKAASLVEASQSLKVTPYTQNNCSLLFNLLLFNSVIAQKY